MILLKYKLLVFHKLLISINLIFTVTMSLKRQTIDIITLRLLKSFLCNKLSMSAIYMSNYGNSYYQYKYSPDIEKAVNKQIQAEQQAAQDYLGIAITFLHPRISRPGTGGFFMRMYEEEIGHVQDCIQYQLLRGGTPIICGLNTPVHNADLTILDAFKQALVMEKSVTKLLETLLSTAESVKDYHCADFVTSKFLTEQFRSLNEIAHHITILTKLGDNEHATYHYDLGLAKSYPYTFKNLGI